MSDPGFLDKLLDGVSVEWVPLGDLTTIKTGQSVNKNKIASNPGEFPVINSGKEPLGFINEWNTENDPIGIASRGSVGLISWQEGKYFRGNLNYSVTVKSDANLINRYLYHLLLQMQSEIHNLCTFDGIPALNACNLKSLMIPSPCPENPKKSLAIQAEIVRILDAFTELTTELTTELDLRKKQYNHYREQLLDFEGEDVEWKDLVEVADFRRGTAITRKQTTEGDIPVVANGPDSTYSHGEHNREGETVVVARSGAYAGYVSYWDEPIFLTDAFSVHPQPEVLKPKFVFYLLQNKQDQIHAMKKGAGVPHVRVKEVERYDVPVPSLAEQERVITILDKFDILTTSLSEGLPREIKLREQQYEYYRDLLLNFPKPEEGT